MRRFRSGIVSNPLQREIPRLINGRGLRGKSDQIYAISAKNPGGKNG